MTANARHAIALTKAAALAINAYHVANARLHDFVSDMIEGGRLTEADIPDDYYAIVEALQDAAAKESLARGALDQVAEAAGDAP